MLLIIVLIEILKFLPMYCYFKKCDNKKYENIGF